MEACPQVRREDKFSATSVSVGHDLVHSGHRAAVPTSDPGASRPLGVRSPFPSLSSSRQPQPLVLVLVPKAD